MTLPITSVAIIFQHTPSENNAHIYGGVLAGVLGLPLQILLPTPEIPLGGIPTTQLVEKVYGQPVAQIDTLSQERIRAEIEVQSGYKQNGMQFQPFVQNSNPIQLPKGTLLVTNTSLKTEKSIPVLRPTDSKQKVRTRQISLGRICIPFGDRESGIRSTQFYLPFARPLSSTLLFYHTSWRKRHVSSTDPRDHISEGTKRVESTLLHIAKEANVMHESHVQTASGIVEGILRFALVHKIDLIVMDREETVGKGSYVDDLLARSPIPVLVLSGGVV